jgi:hypothetical protein
LVRTLYLLIVASLASAALSGRAQAQWYVESSFGTLVRQSADRSTSVTDRSTGTSGNARLTYNFDPGITANLALGYKFETGIRLATEVGYSRYGIGSVQARSTDGKFPVLNGLAFGRQWGVSSTTSPAR